MLPLVSKGRGERKVALRYLVIKLVWRKRRSWIHSLRADTELCAEHSPRSWQMALGRNLLRHLAPCRAGSLSGFEA